MPQILVLQLSRVGDLIHTTPMMRELVARGSDVAVDVLTLDELTPLLDGLGVRRIHTLPRAESAMLHEEVRLFCLQGRTPVELPQRLAQLSLPVYDRLISPDYSLPGAWLAARIPAREREGVFIDERGQGWFHSSWCSFRFGVSRRMSAGRINVVDLWRGMVRAEPGTAAGLPRLHAAQTPTLPFALPQGRRVALNPGAHDRWRCWPAESFARLAERLTANGYSVLLTGAPPDRELSEEIIRHSSAPLYDCTGRTSLPEMARLMSEVELLISNDTGAAHLAAAAGTPVLGLYGDIANFAETAPWIEGNLILHRPGASLFQRGEPLPEAVVWQAAQVMLGMQPISTLADELARSGVQAWQTCFLPVDSDPLGGLACLPLHPHGFNGEELLRQTMRHALAWTLCGQRGPLSTSFLIGQVRAGRVSAAPGLLAEAVSLMRRAVTLAGHLESIGGNIRAVLAGSPASSTLAQCAASSMMQLQPVFDQSEPSDALAELLVFLRKHLDTALLRGGDGVLPAMAQYLEHTMAILACALRLMVEVLEGLSATAAFTAQTGRETA